MSMFDRVIQILGFLLGLLVLFEYVRKQTLEASLFIVLLLLVAGVIAYRYIEQNRPLFTVLDGQKHLKFQSGPPDNDALLTHRVIAKANFTGLTQFWFRNITADGPIQNFMIDGVPVNASMKGGTYEFCKEFARPLKKGETATIVASYELIKSYPSPREGLTHIANTETKKLKLVVEFHQAKPGRDCKCFLGGGGGIEKELDRPKSTNGNTTLEMDLTDLQTGAYYTLEWIW